MMRKIIIALAIAMLAAPAMAVHQVDITCTDVNGIVTVSYDTTGGDPGLVRAFGLDVTVSAGKISGMWNFNPKYNIYPGSIDINDATGLVDDSGSPIGDPCQYPGVTQGGIGTQGVTVEMASLYVGGPNAPAAQGVLFKFAVCWSCNVTISQNAARGGVVMEDNAAVTVIAPGNGAAVYAVTVGPTCTDYPFFTSGDLAGNPLPPFLGGNDGKPDCVVSSFDLSIIAAAWDSNDLDPGWNPCSDIAGNPLPPFLGGTDGKPDGFCNSFDLSRLAAYWGRGDTSEWTGQWAP